MPNARSFDLKNGIGSFQEAGPGKRNHCLLWFNECNKNSYSNSAPFHAEGTGRVAEWLCMLSQYSQQSGKTNHSQGFLHASYEV